MQPGWDTLPPLTWLNHYTFGCFLGLWVMLRPGLGAQARSGGGHTCHTPNCMNLVSVLLLPWQSTLYNRQPPHTTGTYYQYRFGRVGQGNGLHIRHVLLPVKL
jgi:hypothetical protein